MYVPFLVRLGFRRVMRIPRIQIAKATVASEYIGPAFLERAILAIPNHVAGANRHHRAPRADPIGLASRNIEAKCCSKSGDRKN